MELWFKYCKSSIYSKKPRKERKRKEASDNSTPIKNENIKIIAALTALATVAIAGIAICRSKKPTTAPQEIQEEASKLLSDIKFNEGVASLKDDGKKYTGIIEDTLKNGDKITLVYKDGIIQKSIRESEGNIKFEKVFETLENGNHKVTTIVGEDKSSIIREELEQKFKNSQEKLEDILNKKDSLSLDEFKKQTDEITYISKEQKEKITSIISNKEKQAQKEAEKAVAKTTEREAQEKINALKNKMDSLKQEHEVLLNNAPKQFSKEDITAREKEIEYLKAKIEYLKQLPDEKIEKNDLKYVQRKLFAAEGSLKKCKEFYEQNIAKEERISHLLDKFEGNDEGLKKAYEDATLGRTKMNTDDYIALKKVYADKFETIPKSGEYAKVSEHDDLTGYNMNIRNDIYLSKDGKSELINDEIDKEFAQLPPFEKDMIVYRGRVRSELEELNLGNNAINRDYHIVENAKIGDIIVPDEAYSYTSPRRSVAEYWACDDTGKAMLYEIRLPKGARASVNHKSEIVLPRGAKYKVLDKGVDPEGRLNVVLEYLLPDDFEKLLNEAGEKYAEGTDEQKFVSYVKRLMSIKGNNEEDVREVANYMLLTKGSCDTEIKCYDEIFNAYKKMVKEKFGLEILSPKIGSEFDSKMMTITDVVKTDNPALDSKVSDVVKYGCKNKNGESIGPEVIIYKYEG